MIKLIVPSSSLFFLLDHSPLAPIESRDEFSPHLAILSKLIFFIIHQDDFLRKFSLRIPTASAISGQPGSRAPAAPAVRRYRLTDCVRARSAEHCRLPKWGLSCSHRSQANSRFKTRLVTLTKRRVDDWCRKMSFVAQCRKSLRKEGRGVSHFTLARHSAGVSHCLMI